MERTNKIRIQVKPMKMSCLLYGFEKFKYSMASPVWDADNMLNQPKITKAEKKQDGNPIKFEMSICLSHLWAVV